MIQGHYTTLGSICERVSLRFTQSIAEPQLCPGLFYYDYLLTIDDEVRLIKRTKISLATLLYLVIRYGFLYLITVGIVLDLPVSDTFQRTLTDERFVGLDSLSTLTDALLSYSCTALLHATVIINIFVFMAVSGMTSTASTAFSINRFQCSVCGTSYHGPMVTELVAWYILVLVGSYKPNSTGGCEYPLQILGDAINGE